MIYHFDQFELDTDLFELRESGAPVAMEPKAFRLLQLFVERRDAVVTHQDMVDAVWEGRVVSDSAISSVIKLVRRALGDSGERQEYLRTVRGRGFRFLADVRVAGDGRSPAGPADDGLTPIEERPQTRYAKSGDVHVAYQVFGRGPARLVFAPGFISQIENYWDEPGFNRFLTRLGSMARVAIFDKRGTGLSDTVPHLPPLDERMDDLRAVMDAAGFDRAAVMGISEGGSLASVFAATHPERAAGLILYGAFARFTHWIPNDAELERLFDYVRSAWGSGASVGSFAPSRAEDADFQRWWARFERLGATPGAVIALMRMNSQIDIARVLPTIRSPALVIHRKADALIDVAAGRELAAGIPGARYVELSGEDHLPWVGDTASVLAAVEGFLDELEDRNEPEALLASVLALAWEPAVAADVRNALQLAVARRGGALLQADARSLSAYFTFPARSARAAAELREMLAGAGAAARGGLHVGEMRLSPSGGAGPALRIAEAIAAAAAPGEIRLSRTLRDLVAGAGLQLRPSEPLTAPELDEVWETYALEAPEG